jgi:hypothetical protein
MDRDERRKAIKDDSKYWGLFENRPAQERTSSRVSGKARASTRKKAERLARTAADRRVPNTGPDRC